MLAIGKTVPVPSAMGESVGIELFSAATSAKLFAALDHQIHVLGLRNEYYESAFQQIIDDGANLIGVDIGGHYATEIDTIDDLKAADARLTAASQPMPSSASVRLAV